MLDQFERIKFSPRLYHDLATTPEETPEAYGRDAWLFFQNGFALRLFHCPTENGSSGSLKTPAREATYELSISKLSPLTLVPGDFRIHEELLAGLCAQAEVRRRTPTEDYKIGIAYNVTAEGVERLISLIQELSGPEIDREALEIAAYSHRRHFANIQAFGLP